MGRASLEAAIRRKAIFEGTLVAIVQVLVFCLLASIYISLATETHDDPEHGHGDAQHGERAHA